MDNYTKNFIKSHFWEIVASIPKTVYFNFKVLPVSSAVRLPFVVSKNMKLVGVDKNTFVVKENHLPTASMRIGFGDSISGRRESRKGIISIGENAKIICGNKLGLSQGCILNVDNAVLKLGDRFRCNYSTTIEATGADVVFGDEVVCGWNVTVKNGDGHTVLRNGVPASKSKEILVGNHVWLCAYSTVLKGTIIGNDCVIAYGALLTKSGGENGILYGGVPAKPLADHINWEE